MEEKNKFKEGDLVVCITKEKYKNEGDRFIAELEINKEYIVRSVGNLYPGGSGIALEGLRWMHPVGNFILKSKQQLTYPIFN